MLTIKKRKIFVDILTIFTTLFLCTILGIIYYTHARSSKAILKVGNNLIAQTNQSILEKLNNFLTPDSFIHITKYLVNQKILDVKNSQSLTDFMQAILQSYPQLTNIYLADTHGDMFMESRFANNAISRHIIPFILDKKIPAETKFISEIITQDKNKTIVTIHYKNQNNEIIKTDIDDKASYDPRKRPWYSGARDATNERWLGMYSIFGTPKHGITVAFPVRSHNKITGIAAVDLSVDVISEELNKYSIKNKGNVFIINHNDEVIDHSSQQAGDVFKINELDHPVINKAYTLHKQIGENSFTFNINGIGYIAHFTPYALSPTEKWEITSIIPMNVFIGALLSANQTTFIFSLIMLLIGLIFIYIFSHKISKPIIKLATETKDMIKLQFDKETQINTHIYEIQVMIDSVNATKSALSSFAKYVPKTLVEQLLKKRMIAQLGGQKENITVLFSDIANFTEIAERTDPERLMLHLSEYLNALTHIIQHYKGNIDKYIGDAIMAFWGAPLEDSYQIAHACQAVLACQREVHRLNTKWAREGKPVLITRFGIHSGSAIVGNVGSSDRLNFTAIGDTVNLAARLQTLNKTYRTEIIVSEAVYEKCHDKFLFRPLDNTHIRGKQEIHTLYELIAGKPDHTDFPATSEEIRLCDLSCEGFEAFYQQDYQRALTVFRTLAEKFPDDGLAQVYIARCEEQLKS